MKVKRYNNNKTKRRARVRSKLNGVAKRPRASVFRSNRHIYVQVIDDDKGVTVAEASSRALKEKEIVKKTKRDIAYITGENLAEKLIKKKIKKVIFDRGSYKYHGRVAKLADGIRSKKIIL